MSAISNNIMSNFKARIADKRTGVPLAVQKVEMASANIARVVVNIPDVFHRSLNNEELASAVEKAFPGSSYLADSISATEKANLFTIFVSGNRKVMTKEDASAKVLREVASNVFRDDDDNIWNHVQDETGSYFVAQEVEDLESLILGVRARGASITTASLEVATSEAFSAGMPLVAYDPNTSQHRFGVAVDDVRVFFPHNDSVQEVASSFVVATYDIENASAAPRINIEGKDKRKLVLDYMRTLYGHNKEFYGKLESLIRTHLQVA